MEIVLNYLNPKCESIIRMRSFGLASEIHIKMMDGFCFPDDEWYDAPNVLLGWWTDNFFSLIETNEQQENFFMDGPFLFHTTIIEDQILFEFINEGKLSEELPKQYLVSQKNYAEILANAIGDSITFMDENNAYKDIEYSKLHQCYVKLKDYLQSSVFDLQKI